MSELAKGAAPAYVRGEGGELRPFAASLVHVPYMRIRELGELAMSMDDVHRLHFSESNLPTPRFIVDAVVRARRERYTFDAENAGLPMLRREIAGHGRRLQGARAAEVLPSVVVEGFKANRNF